MFLIPVEEPPIEDIAMKEWLSRMIVLQNAAFNRVYQTIFDLDLEVILQAKSSIAQGPSVTDVPYQVTFGTTPEVERTDEIELLPDGSIEFKKTGQSIIFIDLSIARSGIALTAYMVLHATKNDIPLDFSVTQSLTDSSEYHPLFVTFEFDAVAGDVFKGFITRDSSGANDGGLLPFTPANVALPLTPSARIVVKKILND